MPKGEQREAKKPKKENEEPRSGLTFCEPWQGERAGKTTRRQAVAGAGFPAVIGEAPAATTTRLASY
jgi:hypothetical protein